MIQEDYRELRIPVVRVSQPIGEFYSGTISAADLVSIADFDVRRIQRGEGLETYLGIQRELNTNRVKEIRQYVEGPDATFPTAVVLAVSEQCTALTPAFDGSKTHFWLTLSNYMAADDKDNWVLYRQIARVIDGQHRIEGLRDYKKNQFDVNISVFIGADMPDQAAIFSTVNLAQTKVNRSLVYDLFDLAKSISPEKMAHNVVVALDRNENSPFYRSIKRLGASTEGRTGESLAQATVVAPILQYISGDQIQILKDRQSGLRGKDFEPLRELWDTKLIFRPFLLSREDGDVDLAELLWNYFEAVADRWPAAWRGDIDFGMLNRTNGFNALMRFLRPLYLKISKPGLIPSKDDFAHWFRQVRLDSADFNSKRFVPGTSGATDLYNELIEHTELHRK